MCVYVCVCIYIYIIICACVRACVRACVCMYVCVYIYIYIYIYVRSYNIFMIETHTIKGGALGPEASYRLPLQVIIALCKYRHRLNGYLVLQGNIAFRAAQFKQFLKLLARKSYSFFYSWGALPMVT